MEDREYGTGEGAEPVQSGDSLFIRQPNAAGTTIIKDADVDDMKTFYKGTTKVLWTGPLSVVSTPTSLDGGEKFSDWDRWEIHGTIVSDVDVGTVIPFTISILGQMRWVDSSGNSMIFRFIDDTTFEISSKTSALGNIQRIIGISL